MGDSNSDFVAAIRNSTAIAVIVKPNSKRSEISGYSKEKKAWIISIKEPAEKNKANKELLRFLRKETGVTFKIKSGLHSMEKILKTISSDNPRL